MNLCIYFVPAAEIIKVLTFAPHMTEAFQRFERSANFYQIKVIL